MSDKKPFHFSFFTLFILTSVILLYFYRAFIFLDPDFGWHIKMGQLILQSGIPKTDPFSYTMPSFPFVDHEWLTNILLAIGSRSVGWVGLSLIYTVMAFLSLYFSINRAFLGKVLAAKDKLNLKLTLFVLGSATMFLFFGVRPQVETWLLFSTLLTILFGENMWKRFKWVIPPMTLLWANLHGGVSIGVVSFLIVVILRSVRNRKVWWDGATIWLFSVLLSLINPYGWRLWHEVWLQASDFSLKWTISEWQPAFLSFNLPYLFLTTLLAILFIRYRKMLNFDELGLAIFWLLMGVSSVRHIPLWVVSGLPMLGASLTFLYTDIKKFKFGAARFRMLFKYANIIFYAVFLSQVFLDIYKGAGFFNERGFFPGPATLFLKNNLSENQIFSEYGWGGYLIWKLPEKKVFIDGRMATWRWNESTPEESNYIMKDYLDLLKDKLSYKEVFAKYKIDTVIWPVPRNPNLSERITFWLKDKFSPDKESGKSKNLLEKLKEDGWSKIYEDKTALIYRKY